MRKKNAMAHPMTRPMGAPAFIALEMIPTLAKGGTHLWYSQCWDIFFRGVKTTNQYIYIMVCYHNGIVNYNG
jgi:hypothetical protein